MLDFIAVPFGYLMKLMYQVIGNYGLTIIAFSLLAKVVMLPLSYKSKKGMIDIQRVQPKLNALQKKYGKDQQKYSEELQKLYSEEGINPLGSCLPTLLTMPIMFGLYYVISKPLTYFMQLTGEEITKIAEILNLTTTNPVNLEIEVAGQLFQNFDKISHVSQNLMRVDFDFLGMNLAHTPEFSSISILWLLPILSGLSAWLYSWITRKLQGNAAPQAAGGSMAMMNVMMPLMSVYFGFILPLGLTLYWIANNVFMAVQDLIITYMLTPKGGFPEEEPKKGKKKEQPVIEAEILDSSSEETDSI